jgi:hypothetical protein
VGHWSIDPEGQHGLRPGSPRWWFTSRTTGRITVIQAPNLALVVFGVAVVAGHLLDRHHQVSRILSDVASGAIVCWGLDELVRGVNPWRRGLGALVAAAAMASIVRR